MRDKEIRVKDSGFLPVFSGALAGYSLAFSFGLRFKGLGFRV
jgi:hypothetical protein